MENIYCSFFLFCWELLVRISKFSQALKEEMKKYVIRITAALDLQKGSKNTSWIKTTKSLAFSHWTIHNHLFNTNSFLWSFECLLLSVRNISLAFWMAGIMRWKYFFSSSNGWHHLMEIFFEQFECLGSSVRNILLAAQMAGICSKFFLCHLNIYSICWEFFHAIWMVFETILNGWNIILFLICLLVVR